MIDLQIIIYGPVIMCDKLCPLQYQAKLFNSQRLTKICSLVSY